MQPKDPFFFPIISSLSHERISKYIQSDSSTQKAIDLHILNTKFSASFYTTLQGLEITLRNHIHLCLSKNYGNDWILYPDQLLNKKSIEKIEKTKNYILINRKKVTAPRLISNLTFGFWIHLFSSTYAEKLWRNELHKMFQNPPVKFTRKKFQKNIVMLYKLRNRIAHHESIIHLPIQEYHRRTIETIAWICPSTANWIASQNQFETLYNNHGERIRIFSENYKDQHPLSPLQKKAPSDAPLLV